MQKVAGRESNKMERGNTQTNTGSYSDEINKLIEHISRLEKYKDYLLEEQKFIRNQIKQIRDEYEQPQSHVDPTLN